MKTALRLRKPADFVNVRRNGSVQRHLSMSLAVCANALEHNRYGIVTGKRLGIAVARNRAKRRLRAIVLSLHPVLRQGYDIVVIARRQAAEQPFVELRRILTELFARAQLLETG